MTVKGHEMTIKKQSKPAKQTKSCEEGFGTKALRRIGAHESGTRRREGFEVEAEGWLSNVVLPFVQRGANCTGNRCDKCGNLKD